MLYRQFCYIAGIDAKTLSECPTTDKLWATHLGFSLTLAFLFVSGITFHATGYVISNVLMRVAIAVVIALTVFMFDRALYQSDWFTQGAFRISAIDSQHFSLAAFWKFLRVTIRLTISFALALVLSVFLELAIFSDTITDKVKQDHLIANRAIFERIRDFEAQRKDEIDERQRNIKALVMIYEQEIKGEVPLDPATRTQFEYYETQKRQLDQQQQELRAQLRSVKEQVTAFQEDMNAEELGQKFRQSSSGKAGLGPKFTFAKKQKTLYEEKATNIELQLVELSARIQLAAENQRRLLMDAVAARNRDRSVADEKRAELYDRIDHAKREVKEMEETRIQRIEAFRMAALNSPEFQKFKDDPLSRMTAYQQLQNDPKDGPTIIHFSWMTKLFVIFLEVVPVLAKMFFSPPSVYAAKIQAIVEREGEKARLEKDKEILIDQKAVLEKERELTEEREELDEALRKRQRADMIQEEILTEFPRGGTPGTAAS